MGVKKSNLWLWVATTLEILARGRGTKKVKNRWSKSFVRSSPTLAATPCAPIFCCASADALWCQHSSGPDFFEPLFNREGSILFVTLIGG